jgi:cobalt-zinc-cadmium efflux system protein
VNGLWLWILSDSRGGGLNERGAWLHVLTDALGSVQVIIAAGLIWAFGWSWIDPAASVLIAALVVYSAWSLVRQSVSVLMESVPGDVDVDAIRQALLGLPGVGGVHDLHVWSITSGLTALSAHIELADDGAHHNVLEAARQVLGSTFAIHHSTIQIDRSNERELLRHQPS